MRRANGEAVATGLCRVLSDGGHWFLEHSREGKRWSVSLAFYFNCFVSFQRKLDVWRLDESEKSITMKYKVSNFSSKKAFMNLDVYSFVAEESSSATTTTTTTE